MVESDFVLTVMSWLVGFFCLGVAGAIIAALISGERRMTEAERKEQEQR